MPHAPLPLDPAALPANAPLVVAVSGGPDSVALLATLRELAPERGIVLHVAHLDHGLRPEAVDDAAFVARLAADWGLAATVDAVDVRAFAAASGRGIEDAARHARYAFLAGVARRVAGRYGAARVDVATAHTADDQAETVLMNIVRGAGIDGLAGMEADGAWPITAADIRAVAAHTPLDVLRDGGAGGAAGRPEPGESGDATLPRLLRPMLDLDRAAVTAYLAARGLEARVDASNADRTFLRNRIRLDVLPLLEDVNPQVRSALTRLAATAADDRAFLAAATEANWAAIAATTPGGAIVLDAPALRGLHPALRRRAIRRAVAQLGGDVRELGHAHVNAIVEAVEAAVDAAIDGASTAAGRPGRTVLTLPGRIRLIVTAETATFSAERTAIPPPRLGPEPVPLAVPGETRLPGGWTVRAAVDEGRGAGGPPILGAAPAGRAGDPWRIVIDGDVVRGPLAARGRLAGDQLPLAGMGTGHKRLQDLFVDAKVPAAERDGWPIVVAGATIVWVPGLRADARFVAGGTTGRRVVLTVEAPGRLLGGGPPPRSRSVGQR